MSDTSTPLRKVFLPLRHQEMKNGQDSLEGTSLGASLLPGSDTRFLFKPVQALKKFSEKQRVKIPT